jgi:hypothetical protein
VPPAASISLAAPVIQVVQGVGIFLPAASLTLNRPAPVPAAGASVAVASDVTLSTDIGGIGFHGIAESGIGFGPVTSRLIQQPPRIRLTVNVPAIVAGASIVMPARSFTMNAPVLEVGSRRRNLKTLAVAS